MHIGATMRDPTRGRGGGRESGAAAMAIVVVVSLMLLAFAMVVGVRLSKATDEASGLQGAADAAALAGAQSIVTDAPGQIVSALVNGQVIPGNLGQSAAADFAGRNDTTLVSYSYSPSQDRIRVTVRSDDVMESGQREERSAAAEVGMPFTTCGPSEEPDAPETPEEQGPAEPPDDEPQEEQTPPPVEDVSDSLECGGLDIPVTWEWDEDDGWELESHVDASLIEELDLEPALAD